MRRFSRPCSGVAKTNADSGGAALLEEPADNYRPRAERESELRTPRPARAKADPEDDAGEPFLRARRRVPVRRGLLPAWAKTGWGKAALAAGVLIAPGVVLAAIIAVHSFLDHDPRFRIDSSSSIQIVGNSQLSRADLLSVFGSDIGRNLFFVPLTKRRMALEQIPWVQRATVMRVLPNQVRVAIVERKPVAFVEIHGRVELADAEGVILTMTPQQLEARHFSFPVVSGINPADPLSVRGARMQLYEEFMSALDSGGKRVSAELSEVDLSDPDDVRATVPAGGSDLVLHFGDEDFLARWNNYEAHVAQWKQQYPHLASVDLRYEREVVLKMAGDPGAPAASSSPANPGTVPQPKSVAKAAVAAPKPAVTPSKPAVTVPKAAVTAARPAHDTPAQARAAAEHRAKPHRPQAVKHHPPVKAHRTTDPRTQGGAHEPAR